MCATGSGSERRDGTILEPADVGSQPGKQGDHQPSQRDRGNDDSNKFRAHFGFSLWHMAPGPAPQAMNRGSTLPTR